MIYGGIALLVTAAIVCSTYTNRCPPGEQLFECGTACEPSCKTPEPTACTLQCIPNVCQCKPGYFRNSQDVCVESCKNDTGCGVNEEKKSCGTACEPTCAEPNPVCTKQCVVNACQCKQAYIRDKKGGACISVDDCPRDPIKPCSEMNCPYGTRCVLGRVICPFVPPCFTRQTRCVPNRATTGGPATSCEGFKCPTGKKCQLIVPPCLPDVSCPPPSPQCV